MKKRLCLHNSKNATNLKLTPYMVPSANVSEVYKNPDGETINACQYCGFVNALDANMVQSRPQKLLLSLQP